MTHNISFIGAGKVSSQLAPALSKAGHQIKQVFSRQAGKADELAALVKADPITDLHYLSDSADLYVVAVTDDAIPLVAEAMAATLSHNPLVVHTSGAADAGKLAPFFDRFGIFYPLQTFTENRLLSFQNIPLCIHANAEDDKEILLAIGHSISESVFEIDDEQRAVLHVAAVFVNNFTNHLFGIGKDILSSRKIPFEILLPLIEETAAKVQELDPAKSQTGPASRKDMTTIRKHLKLLGEFPEYQKLYHQFTIGINERMSKAMKP